MHSNLKGKRALVSGSSKGIGFFIAKKLIDEGYQVIINGRDLNQLNKATSELKSSIGIKADLTKCSEAKMLIEKTEEKLGGLDILVCNVGSGKSVPIGKETHKEWQRVFDINLWSTTNLIEAGRCLLEKSKGSIICISSICGKEVITGAPLTYSVAKAALNAYVKGISKNLGESGVRINAICPGNILFEGSVWDNKLQKNPGMVKKMLDKNVPLKKLGTGEDVANLASFLSSDEASFATGGIWVLDGGQTQCF